MKVFISWSGETSHKVAIILHDWLSTILYSIEPWVSSEDIEKGVKWNEEIMNQLAETTLGIICIDPSNVQSPWLNFEAGAISKTFDGKVIPILVGMSSSDLKGPLAQFQATTLEKDDIQKLINSLNNELGSNKIPHEQLKNSFEVSWPWLKESFDEIEQRVGQSSDQNTIHMPTSSSNLLGMTTCEIDILKYLVDSGSSDFDTIVENTNVHPEKVQYYLKNLEEQELIHFSDLFDEFWMISQDGINFLIANEYI